VEYNGVWAVHTFPCCLLKIAECDARRFRRITRCGTWFFHHP